MLLDAQGNHFSESLEAVMFGYDYPVPVLRITGADGDDRCSTSPSFLGYPVPPCSRIMRDTATANPTTVATPANAWTATGQLIEKPFGVDQV